MPEPDPRAQLTADDRRLLAGASAMPVKLTAPPQPLVLTFAQRKLPEAAGGPDAAVSYAVDASGNGETRKLVFHLQHVSERGIKAVGIALEPRLLQIIHTVPGEMRGEYSDSPLFRNQVDLIVWGVPTAYATYVQNMVLRTLTDEATYAGVVV